MNRLSPIVLCLLLFACAAAAQAQGSTQYPSSLDTTTSLPQAVDQRATYLTASATSGATSITVNSTAGVPSSGVLQIDSELMSYATASGATFTVARGFSGTTAAAHSANATVRFPVSAAHVNGTSGAVIELEKKLGPGGSNASSATTGHCLVKQADGTTQWASCGGGGGGGSGDALTTQPLSQFAATTSAQLRTVLSDETGSGAAVFGTSPNITTPTGIVKGDVGLGNVVNLDTSTTANITDSTDKRFVTDAQLVVVGNTSGTNTGDQTSIAGIAGTTAQFNTALSDNDFATLAGSETLTNKTLTTPTVGDFTNAQHGHTNAAGGGTLNASAVAAGTVATARLGTGTADATTFLRGDQTWATPAGGTAINATDGTVPVRSNSATFIDSPLTVSGGNVSASGGLYAPIIGYSSSNNTFLGNGFGLVMNSTDPIRWRTTSGGALETGIIVSAAGELEINNGTPGTYRDLKLRTLTASTAVVSPLFNGLAVTNNGTNTLNIAAGKTATVSNSLTFAGTDGSTLNIGTGGTLGANAFNVTGPVTFGTTTAPACSNGGGTTTYIGAGASSNTTEASVVRYVSPVASTLNKLFVKIGGNVPASQSAAFVVMKNGSTTALTCTVAAGASTCSDTSNTFTTAAGDLVDLRVVCSGGTTALTVSVSGTLIVQ